MKNTLIFLIVLAVGLGGWMLASGKSPRDLLALIGGGAAAEQVLADAEQGDAAAQFRAASLLLVPENAARAGLEPDPVAGIGWLRKAAENGDNRARFALALKHIAGDRVVKDDEAARQLFLDMAEDGVTSAQAVAGDMFERGWTLPPSGDMALRFYRQAAWGGSGEARARLARLLDRGEVPPSRRAEIAVLAASPVDLEKLATVFQIALTQRALQAEDEAVTQARTEMFEGGAIFAGILRPAAADAGIDPSLLDDVQAEIFLTDTERLAWQMLRERHDPLAEKGGAERMSEGMSADRIADAAALADAADEKWASQ